MNYYFWSDVIGDESRDLLLCKQGSRRLHSAVLPVHTLYVIQNIHSVRLRQEDWTAASWDGGAWFLQFLWKFRACLWPQHSSSSSQAQQYWWYRRLEISVVRFSITLPVEEWLCLSSQHGQGWVHQQCNCCPWREWGSLGIIWPPAVRPLAMWLCHLFLPLRNKPLNLGSLI